ncbi:UPF0302 protein YpiB [Thalassobacillus devorans]|uniref:UPF0302 protein GCM10007216_17590 n=1 Tax=Thalassobacillus devorans TaxID=279813 RepID=A0ABQ1P1S9_9BACI|nr:ReoY family proteolytic degradation factor [Thalassobacillus devorans]NIK28297.1 uncharacterized protein YpiB (UPF0302 family) [Thalassobacillus devorans]GGC87368.1 UPF0302 protein YpiB [Thalassobacillus devorans]
METPISVQDKKDFVRWFLNHYQLKKRESVWILNYLINHEAILQHAHFVDEVEFCPRGILISAQGVKAPPFRFYKDKVMTTDAEKSFHDIRLNQEEPLYIQLNFDQANQSARYAAVLEENPYVPLNHYLTAKDKKLAGRLLDISLLEHQKQQLEREIDEALDNGDRAAFNNVSALLKKVKQELAEISEQ